ncbi:MocR-like pyridoxine biosynthesis transcription factor PdxR [Bacillus sp. FJAT-42315]|uniref:MocR-like pyridoxine biosynthesis transcription factor PdxR n=1 Tax=Bacillus sp. FJAT-42315 TaxID=2014077 RepID=UPI000C240054|nr:PLP-dependent aminotransferase family protein [Bacillus sp. FJAT-42315]
MMKIDRHDDKPIWKQLLNQAVHNITSGKWKAGYRLPPTRELAQQLGVARSTVQTVYEELFSRGYTVTSRRGGTRVSDWSQPIISKEQRRLHHLTPPSFPALEEAVGRFHDWSEGKRNNDVDIDFSPHEPYLDSLFLKKWRQSFLQASDKAGLSCWTYGNSFGYEPLRYQIQNFLSVSRGIHVDIEQILLTSGAQQSIDLISQGLLLERDTVAVEDPGFPPAWLTMMYRNRNVVPVQVDEQGIVVECIPKQSKLIFVTPSHQSATGVIMSVKRRRQLFELAIRNEAWIIEDDYDGEFRHSGEPLPTLFSQEPEHTIYLMSFSKMIAPGIRISAIIGPVEAIAQLARVQKLTSRHLPIMEQLTLAHFIEHGHFMRHMRRVRNIYRRRHEAMIKAIASTKLEEVFSVKGVETGLHMLLEAGEDFNEEEMTNKVLENGVRVYPLSSYCLESERKGWVLGYSKVNEETIMRGINQLSNIIR